VARVAKPIETGLRDLFGHEDAGHVAQVWLARSPHRQLIGWPRKKARMRPFWTSMTATSEEQQAPGLPWWPALDALRGLAVVAVLVYHHDPSWLPGGFLGVSLFFTLSGFLITSLLLDEHARTGRIALGRFWGRRVRRLLPAASAGIVGSLVIINVLYPPTARIGPIHHAGAAAANIANWFSIHQGTTYDAALGFSSPLEHYWSLAIEEQFYVVFPLLAAIALRWRRGLVVMVGSLLCTSVAVSALVDNPNREYLGTDTRAAELLIGAALAIGLRHWTRVHGSRGARLVALDVAGAIALAVTLLSWRVVPLSSQLLYRGGLATVALVSATLIAGAIHGRRLPDAIAPRSLQLLGRVSYGVYIAHVPVYLVLDPARTNLSGVPLLALRVVATLGIAALSWVLIERPVRYGVRLGAIKGPAAYVTALATVAALIVSANAVAQHAEAHSRELALAPFATSGDSSGSASGTEARANPSVQPGDAASAGDGVTSGGGTPAARPATTPTKRPSPARTRVPIRLAVVGDSTAVANGEGIERWADRTGEGDVRTVAHNGSVVLQGHQARARKGWMRTYPDANILEADMRAAATLRPDAIIVFVGSSQLVDWRLAGDDVWRSFGDAVFEQHYVAAIDAFLRSVDDLHVPILWADVPTPDWQPPSSATNPGVGEPSMNDSERTRRLDALTRKAVAAHPNVTMIAYTAAIADNGTIDPATRPDGLHMDPAFIDADMDGRLGAALRAGYQSVMANPRASLGTPRHTFWGA
jgi:peptidoglycan/LPS O-acetylase OafA/YrhL